MTVGDSDPTVQTPRAPSAASAGRRAISLAEIDVLCRKAARGAGYHWGMAEEAGRAARTLAAWHRPGPEALLDVLQALDGAPDAHAPRPHEAAPHAVWRPPLEPLCPIATGAALSDRAARLRDGAEVTLGALLAPTLLLPFLCAAARDLGGGFRVRGAGTELLATRAGPFPAAGALPARVERLVIAFAHEAPDATVADGTASDVSALYPARADTMDTTTPETSSSDATGRNEAAGNVAPCSIEADTWRALDRFASRTYVPTSETSQADAGAATGDDD